MHSCCSCHIISSPKQFYVLWRTYTWQLLACPMFQLKTSLVLHNMDYFCICRKAHTSYSLPVLLDQEFPLNSSRNVDSSLPSLRLRPLNTFIFAKNEESSSKIPRSHPSLSAIIAPIFWNDVSFISQCTSSMH